MVGGWLSRMITRCWQPSEVPQPSRAVQVTILVPMGKLDGALLLRLVTAQLVMTVGVPRNTPVAKQTPAFAETITSGGQVIRGGSVLLTVTRCVQLFVLPARSITVQRTGVTPMG